MDTKERIVRMAIRLAEIERKTIKAVLDVNPYSEILQLEINAIARVKACHSSKDRLAILHQAQRERDGFMRIARQQQNTSALIQRVAKLDIELANLHRELYWIDYQNEKRLKTKN